MKIKQVAERLKSEPVRKKAKQILAVALAVLMANPFTNYGVTTHAQEGATITSFGNLSSEIATQHLAVGVEESDIQLPDTLDVTISVYGADTEQTETETTTLEERTLMGITWKINAESSGSDPFNSANAGTIFFYEPALPEGYTLADGVSLPQIQVMIEENDRWAINQSQTIDGIEITVKAEKDVFPEGAVLHAEKVTSAEDTVKIQDAVSEEVQSADTAKIVTKLISFDITITDADGNELQPDTSKGMVKVSFENLSLVSENTQADKELKVFHMDEALESATELEVTVKNEEKTLEANADHFSVYTVVELTDEIRVNVEAEIKASDDTLTYYDIIEEAFAAAQNTNGCTVKLLKDSVTEVPVEITGGNFTLDLNGKTISYTDQDEHGGTHALLLKEGSNAELTVKDSVGNGGIIATNARNSIVVGSSCKLTLYAGSYTGIDTMPELVSSALADGADFESLDNADEWISRATITSFSMKHVDNVRVGKMPASIEVSEQGGGVHYYENITDAIAGAISYEGSTLKLNKDISLNNDLNITGGTFNFDLNGNTLTFAREMNNVTIQSGADISFRDSVGTGKISNSGKYAPTIYIFDGGNIKLFGGSYENRNGEGKSITIGGTGNVGNLLAEEHIYRSLNDNSYISNTSSDEIGSVKVVPAPVKIINEPQDIVVQPDYTELPKFALGATKTGTDDFTCQWYSVGTCAGGSDEAMDGEVMPMLAIETGKSAGQYKYFCEFTCTDYKVRTRTVTLFVLNGNGAAQLEEDGGQITAYSTIETAIEAAKKKIGSTVKLVEDVNTAETIELSEGDFAIDLNGHTWTAAKTALFLKSGVSITLKDSGTGGTLQSSAYGVIRIEETSYTVTATLNIESGIYKCTNTGMGNVIQSNNTLDIPQNIAVINISGGEFSIAPHTSGYAAYIVNATLNISGGKFLSSNYFKQVNAQLSGGEFNAIRNDGGIVATLLKSGCGFRTISSASISDGKWVNQIEGASSTDNDLSHQSLTYKTRVERLPLEIKTQPTAPANAVYGYTSAPQVSMLADRTAAATPGGDAPIYRLWRVKSGMETVDTPIGDADFSNTKTMPTGLSAGEHRFYMTAECDGAILRSSIFTFTVEKAMPTITLDVIVYEDEPFIYGNLMYFNATITGTNGDYPDGTVTFMDGNKVLFADVDYSTYSHFYQMGSDDVPAGMHSFTAVYTPSTNGTGKNYVGVTSSAVEQTIAKADQSISITEVDGKKYKDADFTLETTGGKGTGAVTFSVPEGNGVLSISQKEDGRFDATIIGAGEVAVTATKASDTNYNEATATQSITIEQADTSIAFQSSYTGNYFYIGSPISNPAEADLAITGASYSDVIFRWIDGYGSTMDGPPTAPGNYSLMAVIQETVNNKQSYISKFVTISSYDGTVTFAYNGSTTKAAWYSADVPITADGYTVSDSVNGTFADSYLLSGEGEVSKTLYFKQNGTGYITDGKTITVNIDKTAPAFPADTDGITISDNNWKGFLNNITFGHFFKENKNVSISATDSGSGGNKYYYYIDDGSTTAKTAEELNSISFTEGSSFSITDESKYIIYAYALDQAGNRSAYICTDGIVIDKTAPTVTLTEPMGTDLGDVSGVVKAQMNETGTITYVIKTSEQSGMTAQTILDAADKKMVSVIDGQADTNLDVAFSGLIANHTYYIYAVGTDSAHNNGSVISTSFTTTTTKPIFADNPTITGTYGQQAKDMTVSQVASTNGIAGSWSVSSTDKPSVGTSAIYDVVFTPDNAAQYATVTVPVTPTVNPKSLTAVSVTIGEVTGTYTYDKTEKVPTVTVTDSETTITASDYEYSYSNNVSAGTALATVMVTAKGNYTGSVSRTFTIAKATAPSITWPNASSITYGQKLSESALSVSSTEYGNFAWTDGSTLPTVANGGYEVTFTPNAGIVANYEAITNTTEMVAITVSKATPAVTVSADISDDTGSRKATLTATVTGAGDGETPTGTVKFVGSTSGSDVDIAGATDVTITGGKAIYTWTGLAKQIYKVKAVYNGSANYNNATSTELEVDTNKQNQVALNIGSIGTKTYGDGAFPLSATGGSVSGAASFTSSDPTIVSISGTTATIHKAGTVTITATKAANNTYNEVTTSVSLTVGKKTLTVKANDHLNIIKGAAIPVLTYTATGLVGGDTFASPSISTTATDTSTVGEYNILISGGTPTNADSYTVTYTNGTMTIVNTVYTGGSSTSPTTTTPEKKPNQPNQPITAVASVTATAGKNGVASAFVPDKAVTDAIAKAQADAKAQGKTTNGISVELDVTMPKGTVSLTAALTRNSLDSLVSAGVSNLEINGSLVQVSFDKKALAEIQKQSTGNISIAIAPKTKLSARAKKIIGTRPVYDITVGYGSGKRVSSFGGGIATVSIPYTLGKNEAVGGLYAVYVDAKGNATRIAGSAYDANSGCVIFTTTHFSRYGIGYTAPTVKFKDISIHWAK